MVLKRASGIHKERLAAIEMGMTYVPDVEDAEDDFQPTKKAPVDSVFAFPSSSASSSSSSSSASSSSSSSSSSGGKDSSEVEFFAGLPVSQLQLLGPKDVDNFEKARVVFLRAAARIEAAKKYYVLDGTGLKICSNQQSLKSIHELLLMIRICDGSCKPFARAFAAVPSLVLI